MGGAEIRIDLAALADKKQFIRLLAARLAFPEYFGFNLDALDECMCDLAWLPDDSRIIFLNAARIKDARLRIQVEVMLSDWQVYWTERQRPHTVSIGCA